MESATGGGGGGGCSEPAVTAALDHHLYRSLLPYVCVFSLQFLVVIETATLYRIVDIKAIDATNADNIVGKLAIQLGCISAVTPLQLVDVFTTFW